MNPKVDDIVHVGPIVVRRSVGAFIYTDYGTFAKDKVSKIEPRIPEPGDTVTKGCGLSSLSAMVLAKDGTDLWVIYNTANGRVVRETWNIGDVINVEKAK